jgi:ceramide glucosyltransferase
MMVGDTWALAHPLLCWMGIALVASGLLYSLLTLVAVLARRGAAYSSPAAVDLQPVTVLKPLCGLEPQLYDCLKSFCTQDYPKVQLVFGVANHSDPAVGVVRRLQREFPALSIQLCIDATRHGHNPKVSNLHNMMRHARHDWLVLADSDIRVLPDYLRRVASHLSDAGVGIVTCAYTGRAVGRFWSRVAAEFICGWFIPSVYVAALLGSRAFAFGATIALRRQVLEEIGGFGAIADQMADDYRLGEATRALGLSTVLSDVVVETTVCEATLHELASHQLRWLRTIRGVRPWGYLSAGVTFAAPLALLGLWMANFDPAVGVAASLVVLLRILVSRLLKSQHTNWGMKQSLLGPLSDLIVFCLWCVGFVGHRVTWRAADFDIDGQGAAHRVEGTPVQSLSPPTRTLSPSERV